MKYILFCTLLVSLGGLSMKQQQSTSSTSAMLVNKPYKPFAEFKGDTLQYLQYNFIERKDQYQGKKLEVLLKDLEFDIKYSYPGYRGNDASKSDDLSFSFYDSDRDAYKREHDEALYIIGLEWTAPILISDIDKIRKAHGIGWNKHYLKLYSNQIVKDIYLVVHPDPKRPK